MCTSWDEIRKEIGLDLPIPALNSLWKHKQSGDIYQIYDLTNLTSARSKYPIMVSYRRLTDQSTWSRRLTLWYQDYDAI